MFTTEGEGDIPLFERRVHNTELVDLSINKDKIERVLKTLDTSKSPGPDGLHPRPLAEMAEHLAEPFQALFSTSLEEGLTTGLERWQLMSHQSLRRERNIIDKHDTLLIGFIHIWPNYINFNINY